MTALTAGTANIKVYYSLSNTDTSPTLCSSDSGVSTVSCTFPTGGRFYLYIGLSVDSYNLSSPAASTIFIPRTIDSVVLLSRTANDRGWIMYDLYVSESVARTFYDLTLGGNVNTYGFIAKFRDNSDPNLIYDGQSLISHTGNQLTIERQCFCPSQKTGIPSKSFEWIRWGYTSRVRPNYLHWHLGSYPEWQNGSLQLYGYTSKDFVSGSTLLLSVTPPQYQGTAANSTIQYAFTGGGGNTLGWSHYEIRNSGNGLTTWAWACNMLLQK